MVKSESSKRVKVSNGGTGIDRISNLPEDLISHILSFLPTKSAVSTSVLSTRWKLLWTSVTNIDLELDLDRANYGFFLKREGKLKRNKFTQFVNRVVCLLNSPIIQKFRLSCICKQKNIDPDVIYSWISTAFGRTIQELDLNLWLRTPFELPLCHNYCNLTFLKLDGNFDFNIPATSSVCFPSLQTLSLHRLKFMIASDSSVSFPNLKYLHLECVYADEDSVHILFSRCPVLEDLVIEKQRWDNAPNLIIRIPSLKSLTLRFVTHRYFSDHKILIDTPALQYLDMNDELTHLATEDLCSLAQAKVKLIFAYGNNPGVDTCISFSKFIRSLSKVKFLSVSGHALTAFRIAPVTISPGFHNLTRLEIGVYDCIDLSVVNILLESMDNLENLVMKGYGCSCFHQSWWTEPLNVPKCLLSRVTTISLSYTCCDCCDQLELLRYFLKNGEVLQLMTINTLPIITKDPLEIALDQLEFAQKILMVPRGSRTCQVAVKTFLES